MRIVHVDDNFMPTIGFQTNFLAKYAVQHGHEVIIVASDSIRYWTDSGFFPKEMERELPQLDEEFRKKHGARIIRVKSHGRWLNREVLNGDVFRVVRELSPDVALVHYCDTLTGLRFVRKARKLPYPFVSDCHMVEAAATQSSAARKIFHSLYRTFATPMFKRNCIPVIAVVEDVKTYCMKNYGMTADMLPVMPLATDTLLFRPDEKAQRRFRDEHGIAENDFVCIYTGKIQPSKKVHLLANAFQAEFSGRGKAVLVIVGSGSGVYSDNVDAALAGTANRVLRFPTQNVEDLAKFYQAADVAIWPGACSLSFFDAQACGLPVVAERISANEERIQPAFNNGQIYEQNDEAGLREAIEVLYLMDRNEVMAIGQNGRAIVLERYDYDKVSSNVEALMQRTREAWLARREKDQDPCGGAATAART